MRASGDRASSGSGVWHPDLRSGGRSSKLGVEFEVVVSGVEELSGGEPEFEVIENARRKARAVTADAGGVVIGCDTDVVLDGRALGKPVDEAEARAYLDRMAGRRTRC